jgi:hypothetical protein
VKAAAEAVLGAMKMTPDKAMKPKILASKIVTRIDPGHAFLINRNKGGSMILAGETLFVLETEPAAYAILAAMGPTYFWFQWQTLRELAGGFGLKEQEADQALNSMLHGAVGLMFESGMDYAAVSDTVPVKPLADGQDAIERLFREKLGTLYARLKS